MNIMRHNFHFVSPNERTLAKSRCVCVLFVTNSRTSFSVFVCKCVRLSVCLSDCMSVFKSGQRHRHACIACVSAKKVLSFDAQKKALLIKSFWPDATKHIPNSLKSRLICCCFYLTVSSCKVRSNTQLYCRQVNVTNFKTMNHG